MRNSFYDNQVKSYCKKEPSTLTLTGGMIPLFIIIVLFCGFSFGSACGLASMKSDAIEYGVARHNAQTGIFEWITNSPANTTTNK